MNESGGGIIPPWNIYQLGGYTGVGISGTVGVFAKIVKGETGIAFVNIEDFPAAVSHDPL